jgi:predicted glycoside hydrolase/deacetylase ChbG (UPF0249 family)
MAGGSGRVVVDVHADDYALSMHNARRFVALMEAGALDSISVIPNMSCFSEAMEYLSEKWDGFPRKPLISVHLNIADGRSLADLKDPLLTREEGSGAYFFRTSWGRLLLCSYIPGVRGRLRRELKKELALQIRRVFGALPAGANAGGGAVSALRLDSHTHAHMIPVVFDAMMDAVEELGLQERLSFVRVSREPLKPLLGTAGRVPAVNYIKNQLLNRLSARAERRLRRDGVSCGYLWGVLTGGRMDRETVRRVLPGMRDHAQNKGKRLEILFHPGRVLADEGLPEEFTPGDREAVISPRRDAEYEAVLSLKAGE